MSRREFSTHGPATARVVDQDTMPGISNQKVMKLYSSDWPTGSHGWDLGALQGENKPTVTGARELDAVLAGQTSARVLDCSTATGLVAQELRKLGFSNIDALVASAEVLEVARKKGIYRRLICDHMGPNRLDIPDDTYDGLVAVGCFCSGHVGADCFEELIRVTKSGGYIVIGLRESRLHSYFKDNELEVAMQRLHDNKQWKWITRRAVANYHAGDNGVVYRFQI